MNKMILVLFVFLSQLSFTVEADSKRATVEELMTVMKVDNMLDSIYSQMDQMFQGMAKELGVSESEQKLFDEFMSDTAKAMREEMTWQKIKDPIIELYMKHYSEKEVNDMLTFYKSQSGQSIIDKMPIVMEESMHITQKMFMEFLPKMKELSADFQKELKQLRMQNQTIKQ